MSGMWKTTCLCLWGRKKTWKLFARGSPLASSKRLMISQRLQPMASEERSTALRPHSLCKSWHTHLSNVFIALICVSLAGPCQREPCCTCDNHHKDGRCQMRLQVHVPFLPLPPYFTLKASQQKLQWGHNCLCCRASYSDGKLKAPPKPCAGNQGTQILVSLWMSQIFPMLLNVQDLNFPFFAGGRPVL